MDIRTYDEAERRGRESIANWQIARLFSPVTFDKNQFPTRIRTIHGLYPLLDSMHAGRLADFIRERGGLSQDDMDSLASAFANFVCFHKRALGGNNTLLPIASMLSQYLIYVKLRGIPNRRRVLEIGSGCGYLSFFMANDPEVVRYDKIEITQSLYILQSMIDAYCYGDDFENRALSPSEHAHVGLLPLESGRLYDQINTITIDEAVPRSVLHPWWRIDDALTRPYDVVTSNANLAEMTYPALTYYLTAVKRCLVSDGILLIQCLGSQSGEITRRTVLKALMDLGFRPLVIVVGPYGDRYFPLGNLLLIGPGHPDYDAVPTSFGAPVFLSDHPVVRSVYGLDQPPGSKVSRDDLVNETLKHVQLKYPAARL